MNTSTFIQAFIHILLPVFIQGGVEGLCKLDFSAKSSLTFSFKRIGIFKDTYNKDTNNY